MPKTKAGTQPKFRRADSFDEATQTGHPIDGPDSMTQAEKDSVFNAKVRDPKTGSPNNGRGVFGGGS